MLEYALQITKVEDLQYIKNHIIEVNEHTFNDIDKQLLADFQERFGSSKFTRLYFGNEFCEYLLPSCEDLKKVYDFCEKNKLDFTFVTPVVSEAGYKKVLRLLNTMLGSEQEIEVVINDWGILNYLKNVELKVSKVCGRLMIKSMKDPRYNDSEYTKYLTNEGVNYFESSNMNSIRFLKLMKDFDIQRMDTDQLHKVEDLDTSIIKDNSIYLPYSYITTGSVCMMKTLGSKSKNIVTLEIGACQKACQDFDQKMFKQIAPVRERLNGENSGFVELYRKGNTVFTLNKYLYSPHKLNKCSRVVYSLSMPV